VRAVTGKIYMLDTNVFNDLVDGKLRLPADLSGIRLVVLGVKLDELKATGLADRRRRLIQQFEQLQPEMQKAQTFCFDISGAGLDEALWGSKPDRFAKMLATLHDRDRKSRKANDAKNWLSDILIVEAALELGATLVSGR